MKKQILISVFLFTLFSLSQAFAQEAGEKLSGEVSATGALTHVNGSKAKFNEYRDLRDGLYGDIKIKYDEDKYFIDFHSRDMFYNTQRYKLGGGMWGAFKLNIGYSEIPHNFNYDARTFYSGVGTDTLTYPVHPPSTDTGTWSTFDYSTKRKNLNGGFKVDLLKPFFLDVSAARDEQAGIYPVGATGTTPGGIALELPALIDYRTDSINMLAGFAMKPVFISLGGQYSTFSNSNALLRFRNPATVNTASATDSYAMPPDNTYYRLNLKGAVNLPFRSKLNLDMAMARTKSDAILANSYVSNVAGGLTSIALSSPAFSGQIDTSSIATAVTTRPLSFFDTKLFFKYDDRQNKSDVITITDATRTPAVFTNHPFSYRRVKYGTELGFRLPAKFYLLGGYCFSTIGRDREDIPDNRDHLFNTELRWKGLSFLSARVGYERLDRRAEVHPPVPASFDTFTRRVDAAAKYRNTYKANLDFYPADNFSVTLGYRHRETKYPDTTLGLQSDKSHEFVIDADYLILKRVRLFASFNYERVELDQTHRQSSSTFDPTLPPTPTAFNWTALQKDENLGYTAGTEVFIIPEKLTFLAQYSFLRSNGYIDYTYLLGANPLPAGRTQDNIDIGDWDGYRLSFVLVKLSYHLTKSFSVSAAYLYEKYDYSDAQYDGYQLVPAVTGTNGAFLTGAYSESSYESSVGFVTLTYRF
jgi:MtrB/PioB family decaheme-associated outer membrane protein